MRLKLTVSYVGTNYNGWQSQKNGVSVQDKLEQALSNFFDGQFVRVFASGRTDVGVHASGQVVHFDTDKVVNPYKLCLGVNLSLPSDISVVSGEVVDDSFDARFSAVSKTYSYKLYISPTRKPLLDTNHCQIFRPLNVEKMRQAAKLFLGTHDFAAFQKTGSNLKGTVRTINSLEIFEKSQSRIEILVNGNAFLYNMVRLVAGSLVAVGQGLVSAECLKSALDNGIRPKKVKTLPSVGLTLVEVLY